MTELFTSGRAADVVLALVVVELVALGVLHRRTGRGLALRDLLPTALSGAGLVLALRASLTSQPAFWVGFWLVVALAAHGVDLARRWQR